MVGTASHHPALGNPTRPITSELTGEELWNLAKHRLRAAAAGARHVGLRARLRRRHQRRSSSRSPAAKSTPSPA